MNPNPALRNGGNLLLIFLKAPRSGTVKTRLASAIGVEEATRAYCHLVDQLIGNLRTLSEVRLCFSPDDAADEVEQWCCPRWTKSPQGSGDLGERLIRAFEGAFAREAEKVVVIGSDCPDVLPRHIVAAWDALADNDLVLGPALDGGYWLVGLKKPCPGLFLKMTWSESTVFQETISRAEALNLRVHLLETLGDIDTEGDWNAYRARRA